MNIDNLAILANYLESLPADYGHFDMGHFSKDEYGEELPPAVIEHTCGTSMCAVGHGPNAGFAPISDEDDWSDYAERVFGEHWDSANMQWCFSGRWDGTQDTVAEAVNRLRYVVENGSAPASFKYETVNFHDYSDI